MLAPLDGSAGLATCVLAGAQPVGLGAGLEGVGVEGDSVDDRGDEPGVRVRSCRTVGLLEDVGGGLGPHEGMFAVVPAADEGADLGVEVADGADRNSGGCFWRRRLRYC